METFSVRDLRERTGELVREAEAGRLSLVAKHGNPIFVAVPLDAHLLEHGVHVAMACKLFAEGTLSLGKAAKVAKLPVESFVETLGALGIDAVAYPADELDAEVAAPETSHVNGRGLYFAWDDSGALRYVGMTVCDLESRSKHVNSGASHNSTLNDYVRGGRRFRVMPVPMPSLTDQMLFGIEVALIRAIGRENEGQGPLWNKIDDFGYLPPDLRAEVAKRAGRTRRRSTAAKRANMTRGSEARSAASAKAAITRKHRNSPEA